MMVKYLSLDYVTRAILTRVYFTDKSKLGKYLEKAINGNQTNARAFRLHLFIYIGWSKVFLAGAKHFKYSPPLRGKLIAALLQHR
jgi:hypothetical protein